MSLGCFLFVKQFNALPPKSTLLQRLRNLRKANWETAVNTVHLTVATIGVTFGVAFGWGLGAAVVNLIFTK